MLLIISQGHKTWLVLIWFVRSIAKLLVGILEQEIFGLHDSVVLLDFMYK